MAGPSYKLTYFDARGRGEVSRYLFALSKTPYEDARVQFADWPTVKPTTPFDQMPVLDYGGVSYCQSVAIERFLARQFGLYGETFEEGIEIDQIVGAAEDVIMEVVRMGRLPEDEKEKAKTRFVTEHVPKFAKFVEKQLGGNEWLVGNRVSLADAVAFEIFTILVYRGLVGDVSAFGEAIAEYVGRFANLPGIAQYIEQRKQTPF